MRILHFISSPAAGGAETYVRDLAILMREKGHVIHIVFLQSSKESGRDIAFENSFLSSLSEANIKYSFIGKEVRRKPWLGVCRLRAIVNDFRPQVIHCHLYYSLLFSFFVSKIPVVYTHHSIKLRLPKLIYRVFDQKVKAYVAICAANKRLLDKPGRNVIQINNAVSKSRIKRVKNYPGKSKERVDFVFVGRLMAAKNLSLLISAFATLKNENARLRIVGEGPDKAALVDLADSLEISQQVEFVGNVSNVNEILSTSDVFLMSSAWEGLPISLIEATLTGLPVIVTNVGGCAEVVHHCANGFVVDNLEVTDYASALKKMFRYSELRHFFSNNASKFSEGYEIEKSVDMHLSIYQKVLNVDSV